MCGAVVYEFVPHFASSHTKKRLAFRAADFLNAAYGGMENCAVEIVSKEQIAACSYMKPSFAAYQGEYFLQFFYAAVFGVLCAAGINAKGVGYGV